jgi:hypothetical protein
MKIRPNRIEQMTLDVPLLRSDTPGAANVLYLYNAILASSSAGSSAFSRTAKRAKRASGCLP